MTSSPSSSTSTRPPRSPRSPSALPNQWIKAEKPARTAAERGRSTHIQQGLETSD